MELREIDKRIGALRNELENARGTQTEVYSRIVGYYRSVRNWNAGKREEYGMRKLFSIPGDAISSESSAEFAQLPSVESALQDHESASAHLFSFLNFSLSSASSLM